MDRRWTFLPQLFEETFDQVRHHLLIDLFEKFRGSGRAGLFARADPTEKFAEISMVQTVEQRRNGGVEQKLWPGARRFRFKTKKSVGQRVQICGTKTSRRKEKRFFFTQVFVFIALQIAHRRAEKRAKRSVELLVARVLMFGRRKAEKQLTQPIQFPLRQTLNEFTRRRSKQFQADFQNQHVDLTQPAGGNFGDRIQIRAARGRARG